MLRETGAPIINTILKIVSNVKLQSFDHHFEHLKPLQSALQSALLAPPYPPLWRPRGILDKLSTNQHWRQPYVSAYLQNLSPLLFSTTTRYQIAALRCSYKPQCWVPSTVAAIYNALPVD